MLQPKRTKYRKMFKGRNDGMSWNASSVSFGEYGLKATTHGAITARQIEAARRTVSRYVNVVVNYGSAYFQINQLPKNQSKFEWVPVKVMLNIG